MYLFVFLEKKDSNKRLKMDSSPNSRNGSESEDILNVLDVMVGGMTKMLGL